MQANNKLALGTAQFSSAYGISNVYGQVSEDEVRRIVEEAKLNGILTIDSAIAYGDAEKLLGKNNLEGVEIISKFISPSKFGPIEKQFSTSLKHLGIAFLYGYLSHRPEELIRDASQWQTLLELQAKGLVKKIGFSLNSPNELKALLDKGFIPDLIQIPYNYLDRRFEKLAIELREQGCEIHARSVFLQGLLFKDPGTLPDFFATIKPFLMQLQTLHSFPALLLKHVLEKEFIDKVVIGVENVQQLRMNILAAKTNETQLLPLVENGMPENILMPVNWPKNKF